MDQDEIQEDTTSMEEKLETLDEDNQFDTERENSMEHGNTFLKLMIVLKGTRSETNGITLNQVAHAIACCYKKEEIGALIKSLEIEYEAQS